MQRCKVTDTVSEQGWYSDATATFGDRVAAGREAVGLSQSELARKLGVRLHTVQAWEDDRSEPRANRLQMLSGVLNVSLLWLLKGDGDGVAAPGDTEVDGDIAALLMEIRQVRAAIMQSTDKLGALEKRLRNALKGEP